ncbi:MAG TPA: TadE/TadG family type IV pilus assembly protein [Acidimicrobiia bacterium]|nr:TadE/TadG family type IV pilus assembly protein [Acidimicrobiia bacterium]
MIKDRPRTAKATPEAIASGERGAALVEAAFVMMLLLMLLLGTVTAALAYGQYTSLQTAARESTRFGATLPVGTDLDVWLDKVLDVTRAAAVGDLGTGVAGQYICVAYVHPAGAGANDQTKRLVENLGVTGSPQAGLDCFSDGRPNDERRVQVVARREATIQTVVFAVNVTLEAPAAARFEREGS